MKESSGNSKSRFKAKGEIRTTWQKSWRSTRNRLTTSERRTRRRRCKSSYYRINRTALYIWISWNRSSCCRTHPQTSSGSFSRGTHPPRNSSRTCSKQSSNTNPELLVATSWFCRRWINLTSFCSCSMVVIGMKNRVLFDVCIISSFLVSPSRRPRSEAGWRIRPRTLQWLCKPTSNRLPCWHNSWYAASCKVCKMHPQTRIHTGTPTPTSKSWFIWAARDLTFSYIC